MKKHHERENMFASLFLYASKSRKSKHLSCRDLGALQYSLFTDVTVDMSRTRSNLMIRKAELLLSSCVYLCM